MVVTKSANLTQGNVINQLQPVIIMSTDLVATRTGLEVPIIHVHLADAKRAFGFFLRDSPRRDASGVV